MNEDTKKKWALNYGCWNGTISSRDSGVEKFDTLEQAKQFLANQERFWATIGYRKWFATVRGPEGQEVRL